MLTTWPRRVFGSRRRCPVCGAANYACGGPTHVVGVDQRIEVHNMATKKGKLQSVKVTDPVTGRTATVRMSAENAAKHQPKPKARSRSKPKAAPETAARQPATREGDVETK